MSISAKTQIAPGFQLGNVSRAMTQKSLAGLVLGLLCAALVGSGCLAAGWGPPPPGQNPPPTVPPPTNPPPTNPPPPTAPWICADVSADFVYAVTESFDSGLGITDVTTTLYNCSAANVEVIQDCCYGANYDLERRINDGPWESVPHAFECDCFGPIDPLPLPAWSEISFQAWPYDNDLCSFGFAEYRWNYWVTGLDEESPDPTRIVGTPYYMYCEG